MMIGDSVLNGGSSLHVCVVGLGYMGLPMAALLARAGHRVSGVDIDANVVTAVNAGHCLFVEPGMAELVQQAHQSGRLQALGAPVLAEVFLLSLPTPVDHATHAPDMRAVEAGAASIAPVLKAGDLVILESTSPMGATQRHVVDVIEARRPELAGQVDYVFCPERAIPGNTLHEMVANDRLVGGLTPAASQRALRLYQSFCSGQLIETSAGVAEMVKLVENASRDVALAFANELSLVCHKMGLDVREVIRLANHHPRVNILQPGPGVGGHCIAVDPWFIIEQAPELTPLMQASRQVNDGKPLWLVEQVRLAVAEIRANTGQETVTVACLGLAYKPNVDDLRESPSVTVVEALAQELGMKLSVVEPYLAQWRPETFGPLEALGTAVQAAEVVVALTAHEVFRSLPEGALRGKAVLDSCGVFWGRQDVGVLRL